MRRVLALALPLVLAIVSPGPVSAGPPAKAEDFQCILNGVKAEGKNFYIFHRNKKRLRRAVRMTSTGKIPKAGYPVGTIIQLFPQEAMIKRRRRFNRDGHGWEFVQLKVTQDGQTEVMASGRGEVANALGSCQGCHVQLAPDHDLVCEFVVGTSGLLLTDEQVQRIQAADPRCK
jgi:hypothetical protein